MHVYKNDCLCSICVPGAYIEDGFITIPSKINTEFQDKEPIIQPETVMNEQQYKDFLDELGVKNVQQAIKLYGIREFKKLTKAKCLELGINSNEDTEKQSKQSAELNNLNQALQIIEAIKTTKFENMAGYLRENNIPKSLSEKLIKSQVIRKVGHYKRKVKYEVVTTDPDFIKKVIKHKIGSVVFGG